MKQVTIPTYARRLSHAVDPLAAFRALTEDGATPGSVLFETADAIHGSSHSLLLTRAALTLRVNAQGAVIAPIGDAHLAAGVLPALAERLSGLVEQGPRELSLTFGERPVSDEPRLDAPAFEILRAFTQTFAPSRLDLDLVSLGAFAFELIDHVEVLPSMERDGDDIVFSLPQELLVIDHAASDLTIIEFDFAGLGEFACGRRIGEVLNVLSSLPVQELSAKATAAESKVSVSDHAFGGMVETARRHIVDGDIFQVVLSRGFHAPCPRPIQAYAALRALNPSPYMFYFGGDDVLFGASPETSLRVTGDLVEIRPESLERGGADLEMARWTTTSTRASKPSCALTPRKLPST